MQGSQGSRNSRTIASLMAVTLVAILFATSCSNPPPLPNDAQDTCPLPPATFNTWFQSGSVSLNGVVNPADSTQALVPDCGFYAWSEQMFLWLTSPAPSSYGGGAHIFDSPVFFDVSPPDASGNRTLLPHSAGFSRTAPLRAAKLGPHRLPMAIDRSGHPFEFLPANPSLRPTVLDATGKRVEIVHARLENGRTILLDANSSIIATEHLQTPLLLTDDNKRNNAPPTVQKFIVDRLPLFIDPSLAVIDVEQGQAGDDSVLEAQTTANGSLVFYLTMVNDVYAYFLTGAKDGAITTTPPNQFPTTPTDLTNTVNFAMAHGKPNPPFPDPKALAIEVKSSWVIASGLPNLSSYITATMTIPTYDKTNPNSWTTTGQQTVQMALTGMHVVGSTLGHPEMVWATFEHTNNAPLATYTYQSTSGPKQVTQSTSGTWLFTASSSAGPFNQPHMTFTGPGGSPANAIQSASPFSISPSDTLRTEPFGVDGTNSSENTEVISMGSHILTMLAGGDIRSNYIMTGATWTPFGSNPGGGNQGVGTNKLSNTTMETYVQGANCFACHQNFSTPAPTNATTQISHIFWFGPNGAGQPSGGIQPLF